MSNWRNKLVALNQGMKSDEAANALGQPSIDDATNLDFGLKGAIRGRPGWVASTFFSEFLQRSVDSNGDPFLSGKTRSQLAGNILTAFTTKDGLGERAGLVGQGRCYVHDGLRYVDVGGAGTYSHKRLANMATKINPTTDPGGVTGTYLTFEGGASYSFGLNDIGTFSNLAVLLDDQGRQSSLSTIQDPGGFFGLEAGAGARCGNVSAMVAHRTTADLYFLTRPSVSSTNVSNNIIAADLRSPSGSANWRNRPAICCDEDATVFYVAYWTTDATNRQFKVLRVSTAGVVLTTATYSMPDGVAGGIWITNSTVGTNKLVVACTGRAAGGVYTKVLNATTLADQAIDVTMEVGEGMDQVLGQVTVGAITGTEVWVAFCLGMAVGDNRSNGGKLFISKRSITAATSTRYMVRRSWAHNANVAGLPAPVETGHQLQIAHQPIKVDGGNGTSRVLLGLATIKGVYKLTAAAIGTVPQPLTPMATWQVVDITNLWQDGATNGDMQDPITVARGPLDSSGPFWLPRTAIVGPTGTSYRFPSVEFSDTFPSPFERVDDLGGTTRANSLVSATQLGVNGTLVLNELAQTVPQVVHFGSTTIIGGCVPRQIAGGDIVPVGFPWGDGPSISVDDAVAGGALAAAPYGVVAIWSYVDEAGKVHRSMPSNRLVTNVGANQRFTVRVTMPHFSERIFRGAQCEIYVSGPSPLSNDVPHYLVGTIQYDRTLSEGTYLVSTVSTSAQVLYTVGRILSNQVPNASGGVATVGDRCWMSDGVNLYASKLGDEVSGMEAPAWHVDDTLKVLMPVSAGRITGLQGFEDKLVVLTDTGVWMTTGVGPNDLGQGPAFQAPLKVTDVGCTAPRGSCYTPKGIIFQSADTFASAQAETGGLWILTAGLECQKISGPANAALASTEAGELVYWPGRELLFFNRLDPTPNLVFDMRAGQWSNWQRGFANPVETLTIVNGVVVGTGIEIGDPATLTGEPGVDITVVGTEVPYFMSVRVANIPLVEDPGGWGRCRSVKIIGDPPASAYDLTVDVTKDGSVVPGSAGFTGVSEADVEAFLAVEKAPYVAVQLTAQPATAVWTALSLSVKGYARNKNIPRSPGT